MAQRFDVSDKLIHFTKPTSEQDAFTILRKIITEKRLLGGTGMIKGGYRCVCFTEAPLEAFKQAFVSQLPSTRYSQFGVMFPKLWVYKKGGRPVIYEPDCELDILPEELRWRHVRYDLGTTPKVDFTWEREWRVQCDELPFKQTEAEIVVPDVNQKQLLIRAHDTIQDCEAEELAQVFSGPMAEVIAQLFQEDFPWRVVTLDEAAQ